MSEKLLVPDIGDFENVEVIELLVKEGQKIATNDPEPKKSDNPIKKDRIMKDL